jgi:hypothetical protein
MRTWLIIGSVCAVLAGSSAPARPHDVHDIFDVRGALTKVDVVNRAIEVDTIDSKTKTVRSQLFFVDRKARIRKGGTRLDLAALQPGQRVTCTIERRHPEGREDLERLTVLQIRLDVRS